MAFMDLPPSVDFVERTHNQEPFISFPVNDSCYVPRFPWNDDERSTTGYVPTRHEYNGEDKYIEYIPVFKVMKEYYDEEKKALYRYNSWSSFGDSEDMEYEYVNDVLTDGEGGSDCDNVPPSTQQPQPIVLVDETSELPLAASANKFMYT